jgi:hypothetical protein
VKTSRYLFEARIACLNAAGRIELQQLNSDGAVLHSVQLNVPVTNGWQTWQTVSTNIDLEEGISTLKVKILQPEFNINWFKFTENSTGISENSSTVFNMYPNPAMDQVSILFPGTAGQNKKFCLRSSSGILIKTLEASGAEESKLIFVGDLPKGLYIVEMEMDGKVYRNKLIVQ